MKKKLYKSTKEKKIAGVYGGIAEYFGIDVTIVRLIFCFAFLSLSVGIWPYVILAIVLPKDTDLYPDRSSSTYVNDSVTFCKECGSRIDGAGFYCPWCGAQVERK